MDVKNLYHQFISLGIKESDSEEVRIRKSSLTISTLLFAIAGLLWGLMYFMYDLILPGSIPFIYGLLSIASLTFYAITKRYTFFRASQLVLILILPFSLQLSLGGFIPSSAVIIWAFICPIGALFFLGTKKSIKWYVAYVVLVVVALLVNDQLPDHGISEQFVNILFVLNIFAVSFLIYLTLYYFMNSQERLKKDVEGKNEELERTSEKLKELDEIKSRFFANISHEFRTPLTLIIGLVNKQLEDPTSPPDPKDCGTMKRNSQRLLQLINQLLDLSKLESGELQLQRIKGDVVAFAHNIYSQYYALAGEKQLKLNFNDIDVSDQDQHLAMEIFFDADKLNKIITNLVSNAVKFTPIKGRLDLTVTAAQDHVKIAVSNSGPGIPKDKLLRIFDRFYQVDGDSTRAYEGSGIGLALVKELVELHGGTVRADSANDLTTFTIELPVGKEDVVLIGDRSEPTIEDLPVLDTNGPIIKEKRPDEFEPIKEVVPKKGEEPAETDKVQILVVEDNPDLRGFISSILSDEYEVHEAEDGAKGYHKAEEMIPDLIISDVMMPNMDGYEMCKLIKSNEKTDHIPIVLLTAKATRENKMEGLELGADDYLVKPFDKEELLVRVRNLISIREKLQKKYQQEVRLRPKGVKVASVHQKFIEGIKEVIEKNIGNEQFGVEDLASAMAMSRSQMHRKLKALTDRSASAFIRNYRLYRAAELIEQEAGNISEIAFDVGFNSQTYFSTCFQELFGCSPTVYKQKAETEQA